MNRSKKFITLACQISKLSNHRFRVGAVITKGRRVIGVGCNKIKTHPKQRNQYTGEMGERIHAELSSIINAGRSLRGCVIYIARIKKNGDLAMARPCEFCMDHIEEAGIKKIVFSNESGEIEEEKI